MERSPELKTRPLTPTFGVEILDVDLNAASEPVLKDVERALYTNGAILLRGQTLSPREQVRFTRVFGEPEGNPRAEFTVADEPKVFVISNKIVDGRRIGLPDAGLNWHTDLIYATRPAQCTVLHALEAPETGSDTLIADLLSAWEALPETRRRELRHLKIQHSFDYLAEKRGNPKKHDQGGKIPPNVDHPMVRVLPEDGRETLWFSHGSARCVVGMPNPEGQDMLLDLTAFVTQDRFVYRHKWRAGDVLVWDNRRSLHTGTPFDVDKHIRHVHRTWVEGEIPIPA